MQHRASAKPFSPIGRPRRQQRAVNPSPANDSERVIGFVLAEEKAFKCSDPECKTARFSRVADLRRHTNQRHGGTHQIQAYCRYQGCKRSQVGPNGAKGKSFGARKDKRDEHERNVHQKKAQKDEEQDNGYSSGDSPAERL